MIYNHNRNHLKQSKKFRNFSPCLPFIEICLYAFRDIEIALASLQLSIHHYIRLCLPIQNKTKLSCFYLTFFLFSFFLFFYFLFLYIARHRRLSPATLAILYRIWLRLPRTHLKNIAFSSSGWPTTSDKRNKIRKRIQVVQIRDRDLNPFWREELLSVEDMQDFSRNYASK